MDTERFTAGPFSFTFRGSKVWWVYKTTHFAIRIRASGSASISTVDDLRAFFGPSDGSYAADGLVTFVRYHMDGLPGALHWAEHQTRIRAMRAA